MNDYTTIRRILTTRLAVILHSIAWAVFFVALYVFNPLRSRQLSEDFGIELPGLTIVAINLYQLLYPLIILIPILAPIAIALDVFVFRSLDQSNSYSSRLAWFWFMLAIPLMATILYVVVVGIPMLNLINDLS